MKLQISIYVMAFSSILLFNSYAQVKNQDIYPNDPKISNDKGLYSNSSIFYFPYQIKINNTLVKTEIDADSQNWYSTELGSGQTFASNGNNPPANLAHISNSIFFNIK